MDEKKNRPLMDSAESLTGSRSKGKSRLPVFLVLGIAAVVCIGGLLMMLGGKQPAQDDSAPSLELVQLAAADVRSIEIAVRQNRYTLLCDGGDGYQIQGKEEFAVDGSLARRIIAQSVNLKAQSIIQEKAADLKEYGLASPQGKITIQTADGKKVTIFIGDQSPVSSYYACMDGQKTVYALAPTVAQALMQPLENLHAVETPTIAEPYAPAYLRITWPEENQKRGMQTLEIQKQPRKDIGIGASNYLMTQPITYDVDVAALAALVENIAGIKAEHYAGDRMLESDFGMGKAIEIVLRDTAGTEVSMAIGEKTGDQQYLRFNQESAVYTIAAEKLSFLNDITLAGCMDRFVHLVSIDKAEEITVSAKGRTDIIRLLRQQDQTVYTVNDHKVDESAFKGFYQELCVLMANGVVMDAENLGDPEIVIHFDLAGDAALHAEFISFDRESYAVRRDGDTHVYVQKNKLDQLLEKMYALSAADQAEEK
ncbi:MAG: DUF4340 domain-containing protein [Clostridia bacterium]|nr:DUF4340 domain-containing protein [Clostridia bacterium]